MRRAASRRVEGAGRTDRPYSGGMRCAFPPYGLARRATAALCRKRPSPLASGRESTWACAILYALGAVNFLFDRSQTPHLRADELCQLFGVAASTGANKAKTVRELLGTYQFDPNWSLPSRLGDNPAVWLLQVNGMVMDIRHAPRELQELAFAKGLIPYVPADRGE